MRASGLPPQKSCSTHPSKIDLSPLRTTPSSFLGACRTSLDQAKPAAPGDRASGAKLTLTAVLAVRFRHRRFRPHALGSFLLP